MLMAHWRYLQVACMSMYCSVVCMHAVCPETSTYASTCSTRWPLAGTRHRAKSPDEARPGSGRDLTIPSPTALPSPPPISLLQLRICTAATTEVLAAGQSICMQVPHGGAL
ncbi:hypothetical protein GGI35DRAFT_458331 [Trichoderma velutinum]